MKSGHLKNKTREWLRRYIVAEILGTLGALIAAWITFDHSHSYLAGAAAGWFAEGLGFYGYFVSAELLANSRRYATYPFFKRIYRAVGRASSNLLVEFLPAEILDNFLIRPFAMYLLPQYIHPYPIGFLVGKFSADAVFYLIAIAGYETRKRWLH